jgi:hypothetical protein
MLDKSPADTPATRLIAALARARTIHDTHHQVGCAFSLRALIEFVRESQVIEGDDEFRLLLPLELLFDALHDAERGVKNPILSVAKGSGGQRKSVTYETWAPFAAAAVTVLRKAGDSLDVALDKVSKATNVPKKRWEYLRERLSRSSGTNVRMRQAYRRHIATHIAASDDLPGGRAESAEVMLGMLRDTFLDYPARLPAVPARSSGTRAPHSKKLR